MTSHEQQVHDLIVRALVAEAVVRLRREWGLRTCIAHSTKLWGEANALWGHHLRPTATGRQANASGAWTEEQIARAGKDWDARCAAARSAFGKVPGQEVIDKARSSPAFRKRREGIIEARYATRSSS